MNTDPAELLALIHRYADLRETAPGEGECGSPVTAKRLRAHAVTVEAEIRARLGLLAPGPADPPRDLIDVSALVDRTSGCPVADQCSGCGTGFNVAPVIVTSPVGIHCVTLCADCELDGKAPAVESLDAAYALAIWHAGHLGVELPHLNGLYPGCPKCTRLHHPWCPPYGRPGYTQPALTADAGEPAASSSGGCPVCGAPTGGAPCANPPAGSPPGTPSCADLAADAETEQAAVRWSNSELARVLTSIAHTDPSKAGHTGPDTPAIMHRYAIRNALVWRALTHALAAGLRAGVGRDPGDPHPVVVYIDLPEAGQVAWHLPDDGNDQWRAQYPDKWDGHTVTDKYERVARFTQAHRQETP